MSCCFSPHVLTRAERDAIARLREQRAAGRIPRAAAHRAPHHSHPDPIVTFYTARAALPRHKLPRQLAAPRSRPHRPVNQQKPHLRHVIKRQRAPNTAVSHLRHMGTRSPHNPRSKGRAHQDHTPPHSPAQHHQNHHQSNDQQPESDRLVPPASVLVEKIRNAHVWQAFRHGPRSVSSEDSAAEQENPVSRFTQATKKRFEGVRVKLVGNSPQGERFVLRQKPEVVDPADSSNDRYFQDLMKADS